MHIPTIRHKHLLIAGLAATLAWSAQAVEIVFKPVAPNVYAYVGDTEGRTFENEAINANLGLVVTPAGALLIDSGASFQGAKQIAEAVKKVTPQPIQWVINTGGQDHRWLGNGYFKAQGAEIMAHADAEADMKARGPEHLKANAPVLKEKMDGTQIVLPTRWLKDADTTLDLGGVAVHVVHRKGGHTPGDSMVWLPQSGVVFTGDVVYVDRILGLHPVSKTKTWLASFEALEALKPKVVVPGHGSVTTLAKAQADTGHLLKALRAHMGKAVEAGTDMSSAIKSFDAAPYKHLKHVEVWLPQIANLTYLEMEQE
ncbi:MAG: Zn-dependent hydrolase [Burkholderiales bacterium RIFCSPHIGHO2_02_FULL_66_10]|jgi:glyoxylase-like metal-dependent hydrolase (beta-lactamase superfamily II)|uniref:MBL fold metallo-hydrolase n=1 Tax=Hydrogenophaga sp. TaxID=1904254 RepID=UPI0008D69DD6|nr:MBL fold metallo-hydrolase [Hydrogenophaga sp.]MBU4184062.1 MBL fold metallo-hydrolase [Gammaproteobacteria bacterium]OGB36592.1 MAG: Zn-dependent hydrolase [Burkholderiales bacterium RIFCSPLOWO2_02_FULL_66_35]OGB37066.1 MAG: Zn-dependent hydrolase [Burkholderiales bacterium RIFCSPHIGHO2_02_FULL_66_10]MBU4280372.1 MBL fold metallo-hydrolase [Gammaproteobacteria bacterium]MBU4324559.1 MBL fold metallo-hydrolase [Gammaproteobacteria bacterium]